MTAYTELIKILARNMYTVKEAREKLSKKGEFCRSVIDEAVEKAISQKYLDDGKYAEIYIKKYEKTKGAAKIRQELKMRGVEVSTFSDNTEGAEKLARKYTDKQKLARALAYRGYSYDTIHKITNMRLD